MPIISIPAHFDGVKVQLDEEVRIPLHARLIVTVLEDYDEEHRDFHRLSAMALAASYEEDEVEYDQTDLKP